MLQEVYIVAAKRTPIGSFSGALSSLSAIELGAIAVKAALDQSGIRPDQTEELFFGQVLQAGCGQAPATQVAVAAGMGYLIPSTLVNKVCASGMKAIMMGAQAIQTGQRDIVVAGGMESMSNVPYYLPKVRQGYRYGNGELQDGLVTDALTDAYNHCAMGVCADHTAKERALSREEQDAYALESYRRSSAAWQSGAFAEEVSPVEILGRKGDRTIVSEDEEFRNLNASKVPALRPAFGPDGTVTAANASKLSDGAAAVVLMSGRKLKELGVRPLARITGFADAAQDPMWFTTAPAKAIPLALKNAGIDIREIGVFEINEAFAAVALANIKELGLDHSRVNMRGGAVALGHPLGASGARIVVTLTYLLNQESQSTGLAAICNGGGGASAVVIRKGD